MTVFSGLNELPRSHILGKTGRQCTQLFSSYYQKIQHAIIMIGNDESSLKPATTRYEYLQYK
jgi:hypothetical protein